MGDVLSLKYANTVFSQGDGDKTCVEVAAVETSEFPSEFDNTFIDEEKEIEKLRRQMYKVNRVRWKNTLNYYFIHIFSG